MEEQNIVSNVPNIDFSSIDLHVIMNYLITLGKNIIVAIIVFFVGRFVIKYVMKILRTITQKHKFEASFVSFINSLIQISLNMLLAIIIIGILGIDTTSFLAVFASAGMAVGMALSGTLQNFAGGVLILVLKPYKVGDFIEAQDFTGIVKAIQIFNTVLTTPDNQTIIIPNGLLATGCLKNSTEAATRRIDIDVEVAYGTNPDDVRRVLTEIIDADARIMKDDGYAPIIPMTSMSSSSIVFQMRVWAAASDYWGVRFDTIEKAYRELTAAGIEIPFQQVDVHLKDGAPGKRSEA